MHTIHYMLMGAPRVRATAASGSSSSSKAVLHMRLFLFDPRLGGGAPRPRWGVPLVQLLFHTHFPRPAIVSFLPLPILAINGIFAISIDLHMTLLFVHVLPGQKGAWPGWIGDGCPTLPSVPFSNRHCKDLKLLYRVFFTG